MKNLKIFHNFVFDSSNLAFWDTERNAKNRSRLHITVLEEIRKNCPQIVKIAFFVKNGQFSGSFFLDFLQERCFVEGCGCLRCVQCTKILNFSYQKQHSEIFSNS